MKRLIAAITVAAVLALSTPVELKAAYGCSASDYYEILNLLNGLEHTQQNLDYMQMEFNYRCSADQYFELQAYVQTWIHEHKCWNPLPGITDEYCNDWVNLAWDGAWSFLANHSGG